MAEVDLKQYFTDSELENMSAYEKLRKRNEVQKFLQIQGIGGLTIAEPEFMKKKATVPQHTEKIDKKKLRKDIEDEDWLPENHKKMERKILRNTKPVPLAENLQNSTTGATSRKAPGDRYPKRENKTIPNYKEADVPDSDHFIFCDECDYEWEGDCKEHPLQIVRDTSVPMDKADTERAIKTAPKQLSVNTSEIPNAGLGIWARELIPYRTMFGPYEGTKVRPGVSSGYGWQINKNGKADHCVDASEPGLSNWMRYVNCARRKDEQNLFPFQYKGQIFYRTTRQIAPLQELLVYYGESYAYDLGIEEFNSEKTEPLEKLVFSCTECDLTYSSPLFLQRHQRSGKCKNANLQMNKGERPFRCSHSQCQKTFSSTSNLKSHVRVHTGERPIRCSHSQCQKTFISTSNLKRHVRVHTGERPFRCSHSQCQKTFSNASNLKSHVRVHTGERPFRCSHSQCQKTFSRTSNLKRHVRVHTEERPTVANTN